MKTANDEIWTLYRVTFSRVLFFSILFFVFSVQAHVSILHLCLVTNVAVREQYQGSILTFFLVGGSLTCSYLFSAAPSRLSSPANF